MFQWATHLGDNPNLRFHTEAQGGDLMLILIFVCLPCVEFDMRPMVPIVPVVQK